MKVNLKPRPLIVRLYKSYAGFRRHFGRWASLRAAVNLQWLWYCAERKAERSDEEYDGP